jgi:hypothetical protein
VFDSNIYIVWNITAKLLLNLFMSFNLPNMGMQHSDCFWTTIIMLQASFCKTVYCSFKHLPCYEWELSFDLSLYNYIDWRCFRTECWEIYLDSRRNNSFRQKLHILSFIFCTIYRIRVMGSRHGEVESKWHKKCVQNFGRET